MCCGRVGLLRGVTVCVCGGIGRDAGEMMMVGGQQDELQWALRDNQYLGSFRTFGDRVIQIKHAGSLHHHESSSAGLELLGRQASYRRTTILCATRSQVVGLYFYLRLLTSERAMCS